MPQTQRHRLKLSRLDFVSPVDTPAQETAKVCLIKRQGAERIAITARVTKVDEGLGLVFGWAFTSQIDGVDYFDLQGDVIDQSFVKAAADFMQGGALTDEMHDSQPDGRVVFCMPMTPEIAKAFGVVSKTVGLMVALKPSADVLAKFKSGEYTGFSIAGEGERTPVAAAKRGVITAAALDAVRKKFPRLLKGVVLTDEVDGHQHAVDTDDPASYCGDRLSTTYATSDGADTQHCHVWTFDASSGAIAIAADSGHSHAVDAVVPPDVLAVFTLNEQAEAKEDAQALLERILDGSGDVSNVSVSIAARAPRGFSTPSAAMPHGEPTTRKSQMPTEQDKQIADLTKRAERAERIAKMSGAHKTHFDALTGEDAEAFLAKSTADREAVVAELAKTAAADLAKRNEVEYLADDGTLYRKSDDPRMVKLAKRADEATRAEQAAILKGRASTEIGHLPGSDDAKVALLKAVDAIADEKVRGEVVTALKGTDAFAKSATVAKGFNPGADAESAAPLVAFNKRVTELAKAGGKSVPQATVDLLNTDEGAELYAEAFPTSQN